MQAYPGQLTVKCMSPFLQIHSFPYSPPSFQLSLSFHLQPSPLTVPITITVVRDDLPHFLTVIYHKRAGNGHAGKKHKRLTLVPMGDRHGDLVIPIT